MVLSSAPETRKLKSVASAIPLTPPSIQWTSKIQQLFQWITSMDLFVPMN